MSTLEDLKHALAQELARALAALANDPQTATYEVQPPSTVITAAAEAAAAVLVAFERGYQMSGDESP